MVRIITLLAMITVVAWAVTVYFGVYQNGWSGAGVAEGRVETPLTPEI